MLVLSDADLEQIGALGSALTEVRDLDEYAEVLLSGVLRLVPCALSSYNDIDVASSTGELRLAPVDPSALLDTERWASVVGQNPIVHRALAGDQRPLRFCDVAGGDDVRATDLWQEFLHPLACDYMLAVTLDAGGSHAVGVALGRDDHEFSVRDVALLTLLRPAIVLGHRLALARESAPRLDRDALVERGLTARQAEVLELVAGGATNGQVALALGIAEATVAKHLERSYRALGVTTRGAAVATAAGLR